MPNPIVLNGSNLKLKHIQGLVRDQEASVEVSDTARKGIQESKKLVQKSVRGKKIIYGVNTGFGPMASHIINHGQLAVLQSNLIRSHAAGAGEPIAPKYVLSAMAVRLNTLVKGYSGVSEALIEQLKKFINRRIIPVVPEHGAVGTSGDLVQLAHVALALTGEGEVFYNGRRQATERALKQAKIKPYRLEPKEGLSLINGTAVMTGIAAVLCEHAQRLLSIALRNGALALELVHGFDDSISSRLSRLRPHVGQETAARLLRELVKSSSMMQSRTQLQKLHKTTEEVYKISDEVQQVYSLRCIPQVLGPAIETFLRTCQVVETEMNSATDNPLVDTRHGQFLHGGNFHGDYIATTVDQLKISLVKMTMLSERRTNFFLDSKINRLFPEFMNLKKPGLTLGLQGLQFVATSTTAQSQSLAYPHSLHSISTNGSNQDIVSMGTDAALLAAKVIENAYVVLAIELTTLMQGMHFRATNEKFSPSARELFDQVTAIIPPVVEDRSLAPDMSKLIAWLKETKTLDLELASEK